MKAKGFKNFNRDMKRLMRKLDKPKPFFEEAKGLMARDVNEHFKKEEGEKGKWEPLDPKTLLGRRGTTAKILQDTGRLKQSVISSGIATNDYAVVGTNLESNGFPYPVVHQMGGKNIPQRKFLWLSRKAGEKLQRTLTKYIDGVLK